MNRDIYSSKGVSKAFPATLCRTCEIEGVGIVLCHKGEFIFSLNGKKAVAHSGEILFLPEGGNFRVEHQSEDMQIRYLFYRTEPIRNLLGNEVVAMSLYSRMTPEPHHLWVTSEEKELERYMELLDNTLDDVDANPYTLYEQKLLLLSLTHRLCAIYSRRLQPLGEKMGRKHEVFIRLIKLIEEHYSEQRSVEFYADKLCLTPKYLSALSKEICGYTVQELVFKSIIRRAISLLKNTQKSAQEISNLLNFPNPSYFGTFFKKQTGLSPQQYRNSLQE
ncbi:MAG: helix-turn-helix transcriptional regulator [Bacteroidaceae bacterium]|nr:helix-turn-helix transcriptional regulator [Bacteroidaceae bacterium]